MSLGAAPRPRPRPGLLLLGLLLLGLLLLPAVVSLASADPEGGDGDLRCVCAKTSSQVRPKQVNSLEVIRAGVYCHTPQLIATMRNGRKTCVDPQAPVYKKIIKKILESQLSAA
ncbi:platelet factor 4-like [Diceros bicornis minor]|uniref:platelet factor 4-like n=1 Tax=Diceros bicornis minor TaxID=77932 RepID=UPI0026EF1D63|nr:platelet factor 4-like [Diceros bicornis minor]